MVEKRLAQEVEVAMDQVDFMPEDTGTDSVKGLGDVTESEEHPLGTEEMTRCR